MKRRTLMKAALTAVTLTALQATTALAENTVLKIGFVGVTSGPAAAWGELFVPRIFGMSVLATMY